MSNVNLILKYLDLFDVELPKDTTSKKEDPNSKILSINDQYSLNENQKRKHRKAILIIVTIFISVQLVFFNVVVGFMLSSITIENPMFKNINSETTELILDFLKYYVSATIVELLGMLLFIIKNVFDSSLKDMFMKKPVKESDTGSGQTKSHK